MPEEYQVLSQFVDRVERGLIRQRQKERVIEEERQRVIQAQIPEAAYKIPLEELGISPRITTVLGGAGYTTVGDLMLQMNLDPDVILGLGGIGPKALTDIENALAELKFEEAVEAEIALEAVELIEAPTEEIEVFAGAEPVSEAVEEVQIIEPVQEGVAVEIVSREPEAEIPVQAKEALPEAVELAEAAPEAEPTAIPEAIFAGEDETSTLDEIFALRPDVLEFVGPIDDEEEEEDDSKKKKKKKKKKFVEMEYDPDQDIMVYKKKRKRGELGEWNEG
jgi:N utilization substance protein A